MKFITFFSIIVGHLFPPGSGSNPDSQPQHCRKGGRRVLASESGWILCRTQKRIRRLKSDMSQSSRNQGFSYYIFAWWQKDPYPYLWLMDPNPGPGGPKTCGSGFWFGSTTLLLERSPMSHVVLPAHDTGASNDEKIISENLGPLKVVTLCYF